MKIKATKKGMIVFFDGNSIVIPKDFDSLKDAVARAISEETGRKIDRAKVKK